MSSAFDKKLKALLQDDVDKTISNLPDDQQEDEQDQVPEEMLPVEYEKKQTNIELNNEDLQADYEYARSNMYGLIGKSNAAIELALKVAMMSEHPRALEVAANLIKTSSDTSKELIALHKAIEEKKGSSEAPKGSYTQVNNYYSKEETDKAESVIDDLPDSDEEDSNKGQE